MPNYKKMYLTLVDEVTNTIDGLKSALVKVEDIYVESDDAAIELAAQREPDENPPTE
jgi:hypothetical protein